MLKNFLLSITLLLAAFITLADLNGRWQGKVKTPNGDEVEVTYNFKTDADKLTGTVVTQWGENSIVDGKITGDEYKFVQTFNEMQINHSGRVSGDSIYAKIQVAENPVIETVFIRGASK